VPRRIRLSGQQQSELRWRDERIGLWRDNDHACRGVQDPCNDQKLTSATRLGDILRRRGSDWVDVAGGFRLVLNLGS
jgi:hypothetical protein